MTDRTRRQLIRGELRRRPEMNPTAIRDFLGDYGITVTPDEVVEELEELRYSIDDGGLYVRPAECRDCGFVEWDDYLNIPSKCPECRSEWIDEPRFTIRRDRR